MTRVARPARPEDSAEMLRLMIGLAEFEKNIDDFAVTEEALLERGFGEKTQFRALVIDAADRPGLAGIAVLYEIPFTYTLKPNLVLKELFIDPRDRGRGLGSVLFTAATEIARTGDYGELIWTVMNGNEPAERFYRGMGGDPDVKWNNWVYRLR